MYDRYLELLNETGETSYKVSKATGISQTTLSDWKRGRSFPKAQKLQQIADHFGVTTDYLTGRSPYRNPVQALDENDRMLTIDKDTREVLETLRSRPEMKVLFSVSRKASREDVLRAARIIEALREQGEQENGD